MSTTRCDVKEAIKRIKTALKQRSGKEWSVTNSRGTAYGWLTIDAPPKRRTWQDIQTDSPEPPCPGAIYRGCDCVTPYRQIEEEIVAEGEEPSYRHITCFADDPWAREAMESGRSLKFNWEVEDSSKEYGHMSPSDRVELAKLLGLSKPVHFQGQSIPSGGDYREEFVARAEGREIEKFGEQYWD
jgi:hypothetical protein